MSAGGFRLPSFSPFMGQQVIARSPAPAPIQEPSLLPGVLPAVPTAQSALEAAGPPVGPLNLPKWINVGVGGILAAVGLYAMVKRPSASNDPAEGAYQTAFNAAPKKDTMTTVAGLGSIAGGAYIIMDSLGFKLGKSAG